MALRAKRAKNGRMMYFKDNKLISKARYQAAKGRTRMKRTNRSPARKSSNGVKRMKKESNGSILIVIFNMPILILKNLTWKILIGF